MFVAERFFPIQTDFTLEPSGLMPLSVSLYTLQETTFQQDMIGYPTPPSEPPEVNLLYDDYILLSSSKSTYKWENSL